MKELMRAGARTDSRPTGIPGSVYTGPATEPRRRKRLDPRMISASAVLTLAALPAAFLHGPLTGDHADGAGVRTGIVTESALVPDSGCVVVYEKNPKPKNSGHRLDIDIMKNMCNIPTRTAARIEVIDFPPIPPWHTYDKYGNVVDTGNSVINIGGWIDKWLSYGLQLKENGKWSYAQLGGGGGMSVHKVPGVDLTDVVSPAKIAELTRTTKAAPQSSAKRRDIFRHHGEALTELV